MRGTSTVLLKESWPFMLSGVSIMVYMRIDQIMITELLGEQELGIYAAVLPLATVWQFIPVVLSASLAPFVARATIESQTAYWQALGDISRVLAMLGWLVSLCTFVLASFLVSWLLGAEYWQGATTLAIYSFTNIFTNLGVAQGLWLLNERLPLVSLYKSLIGLAVCVVGNLVLLPSIGIVGAVIVAVLSQLTSAVLSNVIFSRRILYLQLKSMLLPGMKL